MTSGFELGRGRGALARDLVRKDASAARERAKFVESRRIEVRAGEGSDVERVLWRRGSVRKAYGLQSKLQSKLQSQLQSKLQSKLQRRALQSKLQSKLQSELQSKLQRDGAAE